MRGAKEHALRRLLVSTVFPGALMVLVLGTTGCDNRLARMEENQVRLQAMVAANARQLATISSQVYVNNNEVQASIQELDRNDADLATAISTVRTKQDALHETVTAASQTLDKRMVSLDENQRHLQDGVTEVANAAEKTASDVTAIAKEQQTLHQMVQNSRKELGDGITAVATGQDRIHASLGGMDRLMQTVAGDVTAVSRGQAALHQTLNEHNTTFVTEAAVLEKNQRTTQASVDGIAGQTNRNAEGITAIAAQQNTLQQTLGANHKVMTGQVAAVIENQQALQADIRGLTDRTSQSTLQLAGGQRQMQDQLDVLTSTAGQTALDIAALSDSSAALRQAIQSGTTGLAERTDQIATSLTSVADRQTAMQQTARAEIARLNEQANRISIDLNAVATEQSTAHKTLKEQGEQLSSRFTTSVENQQRLQGDVDALVATAGQTALDVIALNDGQTRMAQAAHVDRQELVARLTGIVESQQQWVQRLDAAQANVQTVAATIATLEQHITKLQGALQPSLDGLTTQLGTSGQSRAQFEAKVNQDIQTMVDAITELRQDQASLVDQMHQIQKRTQTQTMDIITAIQQLRQPPAEVKVSNAGASESAVTLSDSGTTLESSVAEAAAQ